MSFVRRPLVSSFPQVSGSSGRRRTRALKSAIAYCGQITPGFVRGAERAAHGPVNGPAGATTSGAGTGHDGGLVRRRIAEQAERAFLLEVHGHGRQWPDPADSAP